MTFDEIVESRHFVQYGQCRLQQLVGVIQHVLVDVDLLFVIVDLRFVLVECVADPGRQLSVLAQILLDHLLALLHILLKHIGVLQFGLQSLKLACCALELTGNGLQFGCYVACYALQFSRGGLKLTACRLRFSLHERHDHLRRVGIRPIDTLDQKVLPAGILLQPARQRAIPLTGIGKKLRRPSGIHFTQPVPQPVFLADHSPNVFLRLIVQLLIEACSLFFDPVK